jgi:dienelactone hydrolase
MQTALRVLIALACSFGLAASAEAAGLEGTWSGTWTKAGDPLAVTVTFAKTGEKYAGAFEADALQVTGIPFSEVTVAGAKVRFVLAGDATTIVFDGVVKGDVLSGAVAEGATAGTFRLARAQTPTPLQKRDVTFANGGLKLAGELILPPSPGRHPAILFLHGSGAEGRWASRYLAQKFARAGFVALIYDKRGVGQSTGDWRTSGFEELAGDAVAGVRFLAAQPEVDAARIGVYGHSQGGTISPLVAARAGDLAFVIASAASGLDPAEVEIYSIGNSIGLADLPAAERSDAESFVRELVEVAYKGKDRAALDAMTARFRGRDWFFAPPPPGDAYWTISPKVAAYRPQDHWRAVRAPVLLAFGAHDQRVPPQRSIDAIAAALKAGGNPKLTVKISPNAGHAFHIVPQTPPNGWPKRAPDYADTLTGWAREL